MVTWRITNDDQRPLRLLGAKQPHAQFRAPETALDLEIAPGASANVTLPVSFAEPPGTVVENPFLILRLLGPDEWRVLARVRVTAGPLGEPLASGPVIMNTQKVGDRLST